MNGFEWKDRYSVHVVEMDNHHKKLLRFLAELANEIQSGGDSGKVGETLAALAEYAEYHFSEEERLMKAMDYPGLASHIKQHAYFTNEVQVMSEQLRQGTLPTRSVLAFLKDWFINHVTQEDLRYGTMLQKGKPLI
jgi:hemerythrin